MHVLPLAHASGRLRVALKHERQEQAGLFPDVKPNVLCLVLRIAAPVDSQGVCMEPLRGSVVCVAGLPVQESSV